MFGIAERSGLGVDRAVLLTDVGIAQNTQSFGICRHYAVFDPVVNHLDEVPGSVRATVQVPEFGGAVELLASRGSRNIARTGSQSFENWIEAFDYLRLAANHHAVAALQAPDAAAGADVDVVYALRREFFGAPDIVDIIGIASVDEDVTGLKRRHQVGDRLVHGSRRNHQPHRPGLLELLDEI